MMSLRRKAPQPIDGVIRSVELLLDGSASVSIGPRLTPEGNFTEVGHDFLIVLNPPKFFESIIGTPVWGCTRKLYVNKTLIGDRVGYNGIRLTGRGKK